MTEDIPLSFDLPAVARKRSAPLAMVRFYHLGITGRQHQERQESTPSGGSPPPP
jgi:hypothetical protein